MDPRYDTHRASSTDRNEEGACAVGTLEEVSGKEPQPGVVAVEDDFPSAGSDLRKPGVLRGERRARPAGLVQVEDQVGEGRHGAGG